MQSETGTRTRRKAYLYGLAAVLTWSTVASAFKISLRSLTPIQLLLLSIFFSCCVLLVIIAVQGKTGVILRPTREDIRKSACLGFLNPFLYYLILFKAYDLLPAQEAQPLNYTWAITLALLSVPLLGQKLKPAVLIALLVSYLGVLTISTQGDILGFRFTNGFGAALALSSTLVWALYWILNAKDDRDPVIGLFFNFMFGLVYIVPTALILSPPGNLTWAGILGAMYVGAFEMGITFVWWLKALKYAPSAAEIANLIYLSPFFSLFFIAFLVGEKILPSTIVGLALIIAGNALQRFFSVRG